ncbi:phosphohydrolase [Staphylococcus pseudintermedius]|uniref:metallophosphoesterase n=1 Tax=Staphylococcus pseudintermedius TaxID=283734 RepID=UPI00126201CF|nr:metallophosphoesterase [Staphylococcus pseudintermedius]EGQ2718337.1 phosphohydrolase [Staphylococcus pseudintermedius]EGQ2723153.1 phosphohydrolase [Staphylococcus pseudintermedius]EGQ2868302.1 phosphohydrolase [Staphylococcus pseudintermedius]EGQ2891751.1 phosphohydrolase [Staphylococcus pseudintermedius]EGQ3139735.1 phosphohydrolase [Staphylococcus pseudintermedius]
MRIGTIADLHFDRHQRLTMEDYLEAVVRLIDQEALNMLIIAGDISNHYSTTFEFIAQLTSEVTIPIYFIPGNHDLWRQPDEQLTTAEILRLYQDHPQCLMGTPVVVDNYVIAGHMGWYDYSFAADRFTYDKLAKGKHYGATWQDKVYTAFGVSDPQLSQCFAAEVWQDLVSYADRQVILVTHVVTHPKFTVPMPHRIFDFFNGFLGTSDFKPLYQHFNIPYSVMGHVHFRKRLVDDNTTFLCPCLGYPREWRTDDLATELKHALQVIQIHEST